MSSKKEPNMFVFAAIICIICSLVLTGAAVQLKPLQDENIKIDKQKNILTAMGVIGMSEKMSKDQVKRLYLENVRSQFMSPNGDIVDTQVNDEYKPIYIYYNADGSISKYALPTAGYGLWSWIYGFIALEGDGNTVAGLAIYKHGETPGLGGECEKPWFRRQFIGKKITNTVGDFVSVGIVKGKVSEKISPSEQNNYVDGMSGATITSDGLSDSLKENISEYEPLSKRLRG